MNLIRRKKFIGSKNFGQKLKQVVFFLFERGVCEEESGEYSIWGQQTEKGLGGG